ncbi:MAG TPA: hypothetical protein VE981_11400 [Planctomycetota bacterium]|nr:hypothetical protein [Planctomycetota bacterium]
MNELLVAAGALLFCILVFSWHLWANAHAKRRIRRWAKENGYRVVRGEITGLGSSLFPGYIRGQVIWAVRLENARGGVRDAWLRCGGSALGYSLTEVEVRWADSDRSTAS